MSGLDRHKLRARREALGLTREQLAVGLGKSSQAVFGWEVGYHQPNERTVALIASVLGCEVGDLLAGPRTRAAS